MSPEPVDPPARVHADPTTPGGAPTEKELTRFGATPAAAPDGTCSTAGPPPTASTTLSEPRRVGDYELLHELGRGGMGIVYKALQISLKRPVALKMILAGPHAGQEAAARFRAEAEAAAKLQHPNIVQIYQIAEAEGLPFFALEYIDGGSLDRKCASVPQPTRDAARLVEVLARAIETAHRKGIVHRDLKPANVLLTAEGTPKIADFGLAKQLGDPGQTASGAIMGTPRYMAPEQASGQSRRIGPAVDIYALGAILYELLTGQPPFRGNNAIEILDQVRFQAPVPPRRLRADIPAGLEAICLKCLAKLPEQRYASAAALADDLRLFLDGLPPKRGPSRRRLVLPVLAVLLSLVVLGALAWWAWRGPAVVPVVPADETVGGPDRPLGPTTAPPTRGEKFALLVGIREYQLQHYQAKLKYTEADVDEMARVLCQDVDYPRKNVRILSQWTEADNSALAPTSANIRTQLRRMLRGCIPADTVLVALTGTGLQFGQPPQYCFLPTDADLNRRETLLSLAELYEAFGACSAQTKLLLVDTCRGVLSAKVARQVEPPTWPALGKPPSGLAAFFACSAGEYSFEHDQLKHGVFSNYIIEGLRGKADANKDGVVDLGELERFTRSGLEDFLRRNEPEKRQTPDLISTLPTSTPLAGRPHAKETR